MGIKNSRITKMSLKKIGVGDKSKNYRFINYKKMNKKKIVQKLK